jgi:hypothetical protein
MAFRRVPPAGRRRSYPARQNLSYANLAAPLAASRLHGGHASRTFRCTAGLLRVVVRSLQRALDAPIGYNPKGAVTASSTSTSRGTANRAAVTSSGACWIKSARFLVSNPRRWSTGCHYR